MSPADELPIEQLQQAIRDLHGCDSRLVALRPVVETFEGRLVWGGTVHVFQLLGHPTAETAYAWSTETDEGRRRVTAVLHAGPVDSAQKAVQAMILAEAMQRGRQS